MIDFEKLRQLYKFGKNLSRHDARELFDSAQSKTFQKKQIIMSQGSMKNEVFLVKKGLVRQYCITEQGEDITFRLIPENFVFANLNLLLFDQPSEYFYEALETTNTYSLNYHSLQKILKRNIKLQANRVFFWQKMMKQMHRRIESFVLLTPEQRYLKFIKDHPELDQRVPNKHIASVLGITPVSLSRIRGRIAKPQ